MRTRIHRSHRGRRGTLLVEAIIAAALLGLFAGSAFMVANSATNSYRTRSTGSHLLMRAAEATERVADRLRPVDIGSVTAVVGNLTLAEAIDFQRTELPSATPVVPPIESLVVESEPTDPNDGIDNDGDGLVDELRLVWYENRGTANERSRVLASGITEEYEGETPGNLIDDNGNGIVDERGAGFAFGEGRITFLMSVGEMRDDRILTRTIERTIALRNTPEPGAGAGQ